MARFQYDGEPARPGLVTSYGPCDSITLPAQGPAVTIDGPFAIGADLGYEFTDPTTIAALQSDARFTEII